MESGAFGLAGGAELAEEGVGAFGVLGPDEAVAGVMGGLRAAGGVTHPDERAVGGGGAGEFEAERAGRVGEPAVVRGTEMEGLGPLGQQVEHVAVTALGLRRRRCHRFELGVDAGEEFGQSPGSWPGWEDALLVVAELFQNQVEVAVAFQLVDLGQQFGLGSAGAR
ncbi:hypothetical protein [Streptomyces sp. NBC_00878]|uniref:hypothetical protein n=1 Tax=Streptomyces sp. NBC_00878 TaxID=2975854 RepID=UPI00224DC6E4|nr:hypothetical protein [Streptomyces sp. NBC_00878]MCX4906463.1 hypothetical protein [Streptomyces sp. NBC_00878]